MKKLLFIFVSVLTALSAFAQDYEPTANWPYLYPDFKEGVMMVGNKPSKARFNIHLNLGALHYVDKGTIKEAVIAGVMDLTIGEDQFRNVGGKMLRVLAKTENGYVVEETKGNYSAIIREDGAYGTSSLNSTTTRTYLYNQNVVNTYNGYLLTDVYEDLLAMKDDSETLPVLTQIYLVVGQTQVHANKKSVSALDGVDKKAFTSFLKSNKIKWDNVDDLVKVLDYVSSL